MNGMRLALWSGAAVGAVAISTAVVAVATMNSGDGTVLSQQEVASQLASDQATEDQAPEDRSGFGDPTSTPVPPSAAGEPPQAAAVVRSRAGTLAVRCHGNGITLDRWSPNAGYRVDDVTRAAAQVSVWFESDVADDVEAVVTCTGGSPVLKELVEFDDHGGGNRRGGGGGGGPGRG